MSNIRVNTINDASGGSNAVLYGVAAPANSMGFRNRIINGAMVIDQRGVTATTTLAYAPDRFRILKDTAAGTFTLAKSSVAPVGFSNSALFTVGTAFTPSASENNFYQQAIEGFNTSDFGFGTASASTVTLSFWVRGSITGTYGGSLQNESRNRSYPFSYVINAANTWEQKTVTIAGDTTGTWTGASNGVGLYVIWGLSVGSNSLGTAGAWAGANYLSATGAVQITPTTGATFYITGVQLEAGSVASPFERRDYGRELMMCQRYHVQFNRLQGNNTSIGSGIQTSNLVGGAMILVPVPMRTTPTASGVLGSTDTYSYFTTATITNINYTQCTSVAVDFSTSAVGAQGRPLLVSVGSTATFGLSSEL